MTFLPEDPPLRPLQSLLAAWPLDDPAVPPSFDTGRSPLCRFDYRDARDRELALLYREADVPFIVTNHPGLDATRERWGRAGYLERALGPGRQFRVDVSPSNSFRNAEPPFPPDWAPHFNSTRMTVADFQAAVAATPTPRNDERHYYLRFCGDEAENVFRRDLPFFFADSDPVVMDDPEAAPARVRCRWGGTAGTVVEAHFDALRNTVALIEGARRWILAPPQECARCYMIASDDHPDAPCYRHCEVHWSRPDLARHPRFANMSALEFILRPGELLFIPSFWLHAIVHLAPSLQCNAFSKHVSERGREAIEACGFTGYDDEDEEDDEELEEEEEQEEFYQEL